MDPLIPAIEVLAREQVEAFEALIAECRAELDGLGRVLSETAFSAVEAERRVGVTSEVWGFLASTLDATLCANILAMRVSLEGARQSAADRVDMARDESATLLRSAGANPGRFLAREAGPRQSSVAVAERRPNRVNDLVASLRRVSEVPTPIFGPLRLWPVPEEDDDMDWVDADLGDSAAFRSDLADAEDTVVRERFWEDMPRAGRSRYRFRGFCTPRFFRDSSLLVAFFGLVVGAQAVLPR